MAGGENQDASEAMPQPPRRKPYASAGSFSDASSPFSSTAGELQDAPVEGGSFHSVLSEGAKYSSANYRIAAGASYVMAMGLCGIVLVALGSSLKDLAAQVDRSSIEVRNSQCGPGYVCDITAKGRTENMMCTEALVVVVVVFTVFGGRLATFKFQLSWRRKSVGRRCAWNCFLPRRKRFLCVRRW